MRCRKKKSQALPSGEKGDEHLLDEHFQTFCFVPPLTKRPKDKILHMSEPYTGLKVAPCLSLGTLISSLSLIQTLYFVHLG